MTYTAERVNLDLSTNEGWQDSATLTAEQAQGMLTGEKVTGTTDAQGVVQWDNPDALKVGVWLVTETINGGVTDTTTGKSYGMGEVTPAAPFVVFLPMTNDAGDAWNYDVVVYPKNSGAGITKSVDDSKVQAGGNLTYHIDTNIPSSTVADESLTKYNVTDQLDAQRLDVADAQVNVAIVGLNDPTQVIQDLAEGVDYNLTNNAGDILVEFTQAGLQKLGTNTANQVRTTITVPVLEVGDTDGITNNDSTLIYHNPGSDSDTTINSNEVKTYHGKVKVNKTNEQNEALSGAEFQLQYCTGATQAGLVGEPLNVGGQTSWTTNDQGELTIDGVHVTDIENDAVTINDQYCLVEIAAPAGYVLPEGDAAIHAFKLASTDTVTNGAVTQIQYTADIENTKSNVPNLPLTGGKGIGLLAAIGAVIIGAAVFLARRNSSKA